MFSLSTKACVDRECSITYPVSLSRTLPMQEMSSALKSVDRKSKLPRTSSTARVSVEEVLNILRSLCGVAQNNNSELKNTLTKKNNYIKHIKLSSCILCDLPQPTNKLLEVTSKSIK